MNVLVVADEDTRYGAAHALIHMITNLQKKIDINITVVLNRKSNLVELLQKSGCKVLIIHYNMFMHEYPRLTLWLPIRYIVQSLKYYYGKIFALKELEKQINIKDFDIIHSNSSREDFTLLITEKYHIPTVRHIREYGDKDYMCFSLRKNYIEKFNALSNVFIAVSNAVKNHWIDKGLTEQKFVTVYDGVRFRKNIQKQQNILKNKSTIKLVMTGNLRPSKGQEQAIKMLIKLKAHGISCTLDLIGDGTWRYLQYLKAMLKSYNLEDCIRLLGYRTDVYDLLPNYDIGLMCSHAEGFGLVTAEYMMAGLPVLASDSGANRELVREGIDGYLYKLGDIEDMMEKFLKIKKENLGGIRTQSYAQKKFSDIENANNVFRIYNDILSDKI